MERLPITRREVLIRYGRLAPHARDRVLDQFYLLIPGSSSLEALAFTQACTIGAALGAVILAVMAFLPLIEKLTGLDRPTAQAMIPAISIMLQIVLFAYVILSRRRQYRKRYRHRLLETTEIGLSEERINLHSRIIHGGCVTKSIRWQDITSVELGSTAGEDGCNDLIIRDTQGQSICLRLDYIQTIEERQMLRDNIARYARELDTRAALGGMMRIGRKDDVPFTRLWCQALADSRPRVQHALLLPGHSLQSGRFEIVSCIGGGGQGTVYAATMSDLGDNEMVVLKEYVLPDAVHHEEHKNACEQFEKEIRLLSKVEHENVIKLLDAFVEDHRAYLVLEHFQGVSLRHHVDEKGPFSEKQVRELAVKMCDILDHLHNLEPLIMHLDFSPENILYSEDGGIKLIDFNISVEEHSLRTRTVMGKQRYMAPEQYRGKPSPASDIYSLGATLYFLLTAREPEPISVARPARVIEIDADLDDIVAEATALEENERFTSARRMKERLLEGGLES